VDRKYLTLDASDVAVVVPQETSTGHDWNQGKSEQQWLVRRSQHYIAMIYN
jgi:hypothetical protein